MDARFVERLPDLALFVAAADAPSLSAAARATGIPVARLSRRLARWSRRVGVRLIDRTPRRFAPDRGGRTWPTACTAPSAG